jgi:polo-like kinase 1
MVKKRKRLTAKETRFFMLELISGV